MGQASLILFNTRAAMKVLIFLGVVIAVAAGCTLKDGSYLGGSAEDDDESVVTDNPEECAEYCWFNDWCNFWTYQYSTGECFPKSTFVKGGKDSDWLWGTANCGNVVKKYSNTRENSKPFSQRTSIKQSDERPSSGKPIVLAKRQECFNNEGLEVPCAGASPALPVAPFALRPSLRNILFKF